MQRVRRFVVIQTANMAAMMYFVMTIIFLVPFFILASMMPDMGDDTGMEWVSGVVLFLVPPLYAAFGWVMTAIMCWFYNLIAGFVGGIAVEIEPEV